jgi:uncharacterized protein YcaQ
MTFPRFGPGVRRAALRALLERGEVSEVAVEGSTARWYALTRDLPALARARRAPALSRGTTLLAPFDSLMWYRERIARLFGFDYRIEVYTPGPKRVHGYYTLPILHEGQLVGRVDAKSHRGEGRLEIRHLHVEPWCAAGESPPAGGDRLDQEAMLAGLVDAMRSLATFVGAEEIVLRRVTPHRLRAPLGRAVRLASPPSPPGGAPRPTARETDPSLPASHP